jgi:hypothetical protein
MGDSFKIQNMLETGYFSTSRARSTGPSVQPLAYPAVIADAIDVLTG